MTDHAHQRESMNSSPQAWCFWEGSGVAVRGCLIFDTTASRAWVCRGMHVECDGP
jgi:hypothetical protein